MSNQPSPQRAQIPIYDAQEPSEESKGVNAAFDELETKQLEMLDEASIEAFMGLILEATFIAMLTQRFFGK